MTKLAVAREPWANAPAWTGRRLLAALDAVAWPLFWVLLLLLTECNKANSSNPPQARAASAAVNVADEDITTQIKSAPNNAPDWAGLDITFVTTMGEVRLTGVVSSQAQIDAAISAARTAEGAYTIHSKLTVKQ